MHYIRCTSCNADIVVKSEYLTFCAFCGKKLTDNFQDWKKENPGKTFDDYKSEVCILGKPPQEENTQPKKSRRITPLKVFIIIAIALITSLTYFWTSNNGSKLAEDLMDWGTRNISFKSSNIEDWIVFSNIENTYEIKMPGEPVKQVKTENTAAGPLDVIIYLFEATPGKDDNLAYGIAHAKYPDNIINSEVSPPEQIDIFFDHTIKGTVRGIHGTLKSESDIKYGLFPGKEFRVDYQNGLAEIKYRYYLVKSTLYMLQVVTSSKNLGNQSTDYFFNSFMLLNPPAHY